MARNYRQFPRKRGPVVPAASVPTGTPEVFPFWRHKREQDNAHQPNYKKKRQQPIVNEGWLKTPNTTATTPLGWQEPVQQPQRQRWLKRQQPIQRIMRPLVPSTNSAIISGQIRITTNPAIDAATWKQPVNQPLRSRVLKRQQPYAINKRFLVTASNQSILSGQIRVASNPALEPVWVRPTNQYLKSRIPKRQQPFAYGNKRFLISVSNTATISGQIRVSSNPATGLQSWKQPTNQPYIRKSKKIEISGGGISSGVVLNVANWKRPVEQPLRSRVPKRQQPFSINRRFLVSGVTTATISGQIRVSENPGFVPDSWLQQVNQPLRARIPKRQQPQASKFRPLVTTISSATISGQIRVSESPGNIPDSWLQPTQQPLKSRVPKRQQPFAINKRFLVTTASQSTINGQIRVATNPSLEPVWVHPTNQPLKSRVPKRQQPFAIIRRFLVTNVTSSTISGQIRIAENPATIPDSWLQPVNQPLRSRVPKRQQPFAIANRRFLITTSNSAAITGQIRVSINPAIASEFVKSPNEPLSNKHYVKRRLYPPSAHLRQLVTVYNTTSTISGQIRVASNPSLNPESYKQLVNQPLKARVPKRQQPFSYGDKRFLTTANTAASITGQIRISENPATNPESWIQPKSQLPKNRVPKRQQPFAYENRRFLITVYGTTATISGQIRIANNPSINPVYRHPVNQPLKSRVPKRQQPFPINKRFLVTASNLASISGQLRISTNPALNPTWKAAVNQFLAKRIPKRFQPLRTPIVVINLRRSGTITGQIRIAINPTANASIWIHPTNQLPIKRIPKRMQVNRNQLPGYDPILHIVRPGRPTALRNEPGLTSLRSEDTEVALGQRSTTGRLRNHSNAIQLRNEPLNTKLRGE